MNTTKWNVPHAKPTLLIDTNVPIYCLELRVEPLGFVVNTSGQIGIVATATSAQLVAGAYLFLFLSQMKKGNSNEE